MEGNYLVVKSYYYTSMLSVMLLDSWSTPVCVILAFIFFRCRYRWVQYFGIFLAIGGIGMLVGSDVMQGDTWMSSDPVKGNLFCILGATFYGISNTGVEYLSRKYPIYEVNGSFTLFATFINLVQLMILERQEFKSFVGDGYAVAMIIVYTICMFILYSLAPVLFRWGSAVIYNLSLMTSDFYSLIFGLGLFGYSVCLWLPTNTKLSLDSFHSMTGERLVSPSLCHHYPRYHHLLFLPCSRARHRHGKRSNQAEEEAQFLWFVVPNHSTPDTT